jgi:hypothetical protein
MHENLSSDQIRVQPRLQPVENSLAVESFTSGASSGEIVAGMAAL